MGAVCTYLLLLFFFSFVVDACLLWLGWLVGAEREREYVDFGRLGSFVCRCVLLVGGEYVDFGRLDCCFLLDWRVCRLRSTLVFVVESV